MRTAKRKPSDEANRPIVREYDISGTRYIVTATVNTVASEDAATKVRRLIRKEIKSGSGDTG